MSTDAARTAREASRKPGVEVDAATIEQRRQEKREKREKTAAAAVAKNSRHEDAQPDRPLFQSRPFLDVPRNVNDIAQDALRISLMSWNVRSPYIVRACAS